MNNTKRLAYGGLLAALVMVASLSKVPHHPRVHPHWRRDYLSIPPPFWGPLRAWWPPWVAAWQTFWQAILPMPPSPLSSKASWGLWQAICSKARSVAYSALLLLLLQAFMVLGYFLFEATLYGMPAALPSAGFNCIQGIAGVAIGLAAILFTQKLMPKK